jgi:NADPH2:quinone reductase
MVMQGFGEPEALELQERPTPTPGPKEILIAIEASACNYADLLVCRGRYQVKPEPPFVPGSEVSGEIVAVGSEVRGLTLGKRVLANVGFGGYASHVLVSASRAYELPDGMRS